MKLFLIKALESHGIDYRIEAGRVLAAEYYVPSTGAIEYRDVTAFSKSELYTFLGY